MSMVVKIQIFAEDKTADQLKVVWRTKTTMLRVDRCRVVDLLGIGIV